MIDHTDFMKKQIVFYFPIYGDKLSFRNDNMIIKDKEGKIKAQVTCYRLFLIFIVGDTSITTGLINRANKFGFSFCLMNRNLKVYKHINSRMEGNTLLRKKQYHYEGDAIAQHIVRNKINNQRNALMRIRKKNQLIKDAIKILDCHIERLLREELPVESLLGIEGSASKTYFSQMFDNTKWRGRKPRIKNDYVNASLDIGYTILFNLIDSLVNVYGFDEYCGVLHKAFYMRKSLVCDLMEPFRPVIDYDLRKAINLGQIKKEHFKVDNGRYILEWKYSKEYTKLFLTGLLEYKKEIFIYIRDYYRCFMKERDIKEYPLFIM